MSNTPDKYDVDMQVVAEIVSRAGVPAYVEQTGGGCATIFAGVAYKDAEGDERFPAAAGPGWFTGPHFSEPRASLYEFGVGPDNDGEGGFVDFAQIGALDITNIANVIVAQVRKTEAARVNGGEPVCLSTDDIEALGLDGTARSEPADMRKEKLRTSVGMRAYNAMNQRLAELGVPAGERMPYNEEASRRALFDYDYPPITERRGDPAP